MAKINVLLHRHRHGTDVVVFRGGEDLSSEIIARRLGLDFEADREDEDLEEFPFEESEIRNVDEIPDPEPDEAEDAGDDVCDICSTSGVHASRTTYCGKTIGVECGCDEENKDGTCNNPDCEDCKNADKKVDDEAENVSE